MNGMSDPAQDPWADRSDGDDDDDDDDEHVIQEDYEESQPQVRQQGPLPGPGPGQTLRRGNTFGKKPKDTLWTLFKQKMVGYFWMLFASTERIRIHPDWDGGRKVLAHILNSRFTEIFMGFVTLYNIVLIVVETDRRLKCADEDSPECPANFSDIVIPDNICLAFYSTELAMKLYVYQCMFPTERWNIFDFTIVLVSVLGEFVGSVFKDAVIIRTVRVMRLVRMLRLLTMFQELYLMVSAMASMFRTIFWAIAMLVCALAVFSLVAVDILRPVVQEMDEDQKFIHCERCPKAFESVGTSMITFFQLLVMGQGIETFMVPMMERSAMAAVFLLGATAVIYLGVSNLILSVIVDKANEARTTDAFYQSMTNKKSRADTKKELVNMWRDADVDMDGTVTVDELRMTYESQAKFRKYFQNMDIDLGFLEFVLKAMDNNGTGECPYEELAEAVVRMKNTETGPMVTLMKLQMQQVLEGMSDISKEIASLKKDFKKHTASTKTELRRSQTSMFSSMKNTMQKNTFFSGAPSTEEHAAHSGGAPLSSVMTDMMCWFNADSAPASGPGSAPGSPMSMRRSASMVSSVAQESESEKSNDLGWDDGDRSRRSKFKQQSERDIVAAATSAKELASLQSQGQEIERNIRNLKSKLGGEGGSRKAEKLEDVRILAEILADIKSKEAKKKDEITSAMGLPSRSNSRRSRSSSR